MSFVLFQKQVSNKSNKSLATCSLVISVPAQLGYWSVQRARPRPFAVARLTAGRPGRSPWAACVCRCSEEPPEKEKPMCWSMSLIYDINQQPRQGEFSPWLLSDRHITSVPWCCLAWAQRPWTAVLLLAVRGRSHSALSDSPGSVGGKKKTGLVFYLSRQLDLKLTGWRVWCCMKSSLPFPSFHERSQRKCGGQGNVFICLDKPA